MSYATTRRQRFTDGNGRVWSLSLTLPLIADIRARTGMDLIDVFRRTDGFARYRVDFVEGDPVSLAAALLIAARCASPLLDEAAFLSGLDGETIVRASTPLLFAAHDVLPPTRYGDRLRKVLPELTADVEAMP